MRRISENITKIESVLKLWRLRNLTFERRITIFETLSLSKMIDFALVKTTSNEIVDQLSKMQKYFIWNKMKPEIKDLLCIIISGWWFRNKNHVVFLY